MTTPDRERPLNDNQQRRLRVTCEHIDHVLCEMENALNEPASKAAFPTYICDMTEEQQRSVEAYIAVVRKRLVQMLEVQGIPPNPPGIPLSRAIKSRLYTIDITTGEIRPRHMRGFGAVSAAAATDLSRFADEMQERADDLHRIFGKVARKDEKRERLKGHTGKRERDGTR